MKLFAFGCSYTKDNYQLTWADLVAKKYNLELYNFAERGAGASYVSKRILATDIASGDLVMIMWPSADRFDLWADQTTPHLLHDYVHASWPDGHQPALVDVQGRARLDQGYILNGSVPRGYKNKYFKYFYSPYQVVHDWYVSVITTQLYLNSLNVDYVMTSAFPIECPISYHHGQFSVEPKIFNKIDLTKFADTQGFYTWAKNTNKSFFNPHYPSTQSHCEYVEEFLVPCLKSNRLLRNK